MQEKLQIELSSVIDSLDETKEKVEDTINLLKVAEKSFQDSIHIIVSLGFELADILNSSFNKEELDSMQSKYFDTSYYRDTSNVSDAIDFFLETQGVVNVYDSEDWVMVTAERLDIDTDDEMFNASLMGYCNYLIICKEQLSTIIKFICSEELISEELSLALRDSFGGELTYLQLEDEIREISRKYY